ncbi:securin-like [Eleutherodactylus coqui]|uniref:securin-like n=1 Tax=Eleutherodactylus coqui TaxID=57060 RepID=UPI003462D672
MDVLMQLGKENGDLFFQPSKLNQGTVTQPSKVLPMKKSNGFNPSKVQPTRRALGNVNHVQDGQSSTKVNQTNKAVPPRSKKTYPDIETFIPYSPLDYETLDVPEEHRLSGRCLAGVALFISSADAKQFEAIATAMLYPMENYLINYNAHKIFSPMFEDLTIDLPLPGDF